MSVPKKPLRSRQWFDNPDDPGMTALYLERYLNFGLTIDELQSNRPIVGIAQSGSDLTPCNREHLQFAQRIKDGIRDAGGIPIEFPLHPIQETGRRPTAALDRNLQCLSLIEVLHGYPFDGVVLTTGCDKTTPAQLMAAASVNMPAIAFSVGPMLNGHFKGQCVGAGSIIWQARKELSKGTINYDEFIEQVACSAPSAGHCNTMGTALTMNCLAEALGMMLPGGASIPAPYRERPQMAFATGKQIIEMINNDITPDKILTREAFENAIIACSAIGGSTNAPIHINAIAKHMGISINMKHWQTFGHKIPLMVNCQPTGQFLSEDFHKAGGMPVVLSHLLLSNQLNSNTLTVTGKTLKENHLEMIEQLNQYEHGKNVISNFHSPFKTHAGLKVLTGNFFNSAIMKTSAIDDNYSKKYLSSTESPNCFEVKAIVFEGPEDYHKHIEDPSLNIDENCILIMRNCGPKGYPGSAEVVNMQPPSYLLKKGCHTLPTMGDGRQSGTSASPSILNISPEACDGGDIALIKNGDIIRVDLNSDTVELVISVQEFKHRRESLLTSQPKSQTWWQEIYRAHVSNLDEGAVFKEMTEFKNIKEDQPRHSH